MEIHFDILYTLYGDRDTKKYEEWEVSSEELGVKSEQSRMSSKECKAMRNA